MVTEPPYGQTVNGKGGFVTGAGKPRYFGSGPDSAVPFQSAIYACPKRWKKFPVNVGEEAIRARVASGFGSVLVAFVFESLLLDEFALEVLSSEVSSSPKTVAQDDEVAV